MITWHKPNCRKPDVIAAGEALYCSKCDSIAPEVGIFSEGSSIPVLPSANPRHDMDLQWPSSVRYFDSHGDSNEMDLLKAVRSAADLCTDEQFLTQSTHLAGMNSAFTETMSLPTEELDKIWVPSHKKIEDDHDESLRVSSARTEYGTLSGDKFRVVKVFKGSANNPIHCELIEGHINGIHPPYEALSYTWADSNGDKQRCKVVYLGNSWSPFLITANCYAALNAIRSQEQDLIFWIDAICIDQGNSHERTHQVGLMRSIYQQAWRVVIFPGGDLKQFLQYDEIAGSGSNLLQHPYFSRVWIIQEIASASAASMVYFSSHLDPIKKNRFG